MGKAKRRRLRRRKRKPTPPRCARQPLPLEGARVDTPSFLWKEVPRKGGGWMGESGVKKSEEMRLKSTIYESTLSTAARSPFPNGEGCDTRMPLYLKQSLPRVGKVASKASRIGFWRYEKERGRLSQVRDYTRAPERRPKRKPTPPRCAPCPFQGKGLGWTLPPSYGRRCPEGAEVGWGKRYERE